MKEKFPAIVILGLAFMTLFYLMSINIESLKIRERTTAAVDLLDLNVTDSSGTFTTKEYFLFLHTVVVGEEYKNKEVRIGVKNDKENKLIFLNIPDTMLNFEVQNVDRPKIYVTYYTENRLETYKALQTAKNIKNSKYTIIIPKP